jgi:hypothetical protein
VPAAACEGESEVLAVAFVFFLVAFAHVCQLLQTLQGLPFSSKTMPGGSFACCCGRDDMASALWGSATGLILSKVVRRAWGRVIGSSESVPIEEGLVSEEEIGFTRVRERQGSVTVVGDASDAGGSSAETMAINTYHEE